VLWSEYRAEAMAAMQRRAERDEHWRTAARDVTVTASNPRPSLRSKILGSNSGEQEVEVRVTIDDQEYPGTRKIGAAGQRATRRGR
jgi:hypothetical protein